MQDLYLTMSIKEIGIALLVIAVLILMFYVICVFKNLVVTIKKTNEILEDVATITDIVEKQTVDLGDTVGDIAGAAGAIAKTIKGEETLVKQLSSIAMAITAVVSMIKGEGNTAKTEDKEEKKPVVKKTVEKNKEEKKTEKVEKVEAEDK
jgi:hypothetical protein